MKRIFQFLLAMLGMSTTACSQKAYEDMAVESFAQFVNDKNVQLLDVRTAEEYAEGHLAGAMNVDVKQKDFLMSALMALRVDKPVAVYCRSGRRSANAAQQLAEKGLRVVNLKGGILAWQAAGKSVTKDIFVPDEDEFTTISGKKVKFHCIKHASIRIQYDGKEIQIDPVIALGERVTDYGSMPKADYILITHEHSDHFDKAAIDTLSKSQTAIILNGRCANMLGRGLAMANGDMREMRDFTIEAVPAYNTTEGRERYHPQGRDNGYILTIDQMRIYIAGDTEDIPEMEAIKDIDVAFLPCNQPYTMLPDQLVKAAKIIKPKVLFPYHYGDTKVDVISKMLKGTGIDVRIRNYQ